jgi:hypothetical protein
LQRPDIEPDLRNDFGHMPIVEAAKSVDYFPWSRGHEAAVRLLPELPNVDIDYKDDLGWRPLYSRAIHSRNEAVIQLLRSLRPDWGSWNYERKDRGGTSGGMSRKNRKSGDLEECSFRAGSRSRSACSKDCFYYIDTFVEDSSIHP